MMIPLALLVMLCILMQAARDFVPKGVVPAHVSGTELAFGFLLLTAFLGGKVLSKLGAPKLIGYIIMGVVAGPYVLDLVSAGMIRDLTIVNGVAVCLIALSAGGELSLRKIRPLLRTVRSMTFWAVIGTALLLGAMLFAIRPLLPFVHGMSPAQQAAVCAMLGVVLASQSPAVVMALINETKADGPVSQTVLALVVLADLVIIVLYALTSSLTTALIGGGVDVAATVKSIAWELFGSAGVGVFIGVILALFLAYVKRGAALFVLLICFVVAEVGARLHLDPLIVTLMAGVYIENVSRVDAHKFLHDLEAASLPVYLVFFALAGAALHLDLLYGVLVPAAIVVVTRGFGFWLGSRRATRATQASPQVARWAWVGLLPQAGLALGLALMVRRTFGSFGDEAAALIVGVVGLNELLTPIILRIALIKSGEAGQRSMPEILAGKSARERAISPPRDVEEVG